MPLYEYICADCQHKFELIRKFSDQSSIQCPQCSNENINKLTSRPSFHLKGGGWYKDGYSNSANDDGGKTATSSDKKVAADSGSDSSKAVKEKPNSTAQSPAQSSSQSSATKNS